MRISIERLQQATGDLLEMEIVERKGIGHPDTICDEIAERLSLALSRRYLSECGEILHFNVDKVLLAGGAARAAFGGGEILEPMELFLAGRATASCNGRAIPVDALAREAAAAWFAEHIPLIDPERHIRIHSLIRSGSADLGDLFRRNIGKTRLANDTSCGVGYAPLSRLEAIVSDVEKALRTDRHPAEVGADIKVMGVRSGDHIHLTVACALIGRFIHDIDGYDEAKRNLAAVARRTAEQHGARSISVAVNAGDDPASGSVYITVTGTSAEAGDDGEAGRGNRVNGLITPCRPMTMESVAGKNAVTHVGKIYNIAAALIAERLVQEVHGIDAAECLLVSQIGRPIDEPQAVKLSLRAASALGDHHKDVARVVDSELARLGAMPDELAAGSLAVGRWPLRQAAGRG